MVPFDWFKIPDMTFLDSLSKLFIFRIKNHKPLCERKVWEAISSDQSKRQQIVKFMIENTEINEKICGRLAYGQTPLLLDSDFPWLLEQIEAADPAIQG